jgi:hypothetical protein
VAIVAAVIVVLTVGFLALARRPLERLMVYAP